MPQSKSSAIIFSLFLLSGSLKAQYEIPGYIIKKTKDTLWGTVSIKKKKMEVNMDALYSSVTFSDSSRLEKSKENYSANEIWGFGLRGEDIYEDYISSKGLSGKLKKFFYRRIELGYIELFETVEKVGQTAFKPFGTGTTTIYHKEHAYYIKIGGLDIQPLEDRNEVYKKKYLHRLFENHPELLKKIETDIDFSTLMNLIKEYNKNYLR